MYLMCFLYTGSHPVVIFLKDLIDQSIDDIEEIVCKFRIEKKDECNSYVKRSLPESMATAF